jgi:hypothetical protein
MREKNLTRTGISESIHGLTSLIGNTGISFSVVCREVVDPEVIKNINFPACYLRSLRAEK